MRPATRRARVAIAVIGTRGMSSTILALVQLPPGPSPSGAAAAAAAAPWLRARAHAHAAVEESGDGNLRD